MSKYKCEKGEEQYKMCKKYDADYCSDCPHGKSVEMSKADEIKEYANWHIGHLTEDIEDYVDDDRIGNANLIGELKESREHWKDILRILNNEETYIDYKSY